MILGKSGKNHNTRETVQFPCWRISNTSQPESCSLRLSLLSNCTLALLEFPLVKSMAAFSIWYLLRYIERFRIRCEFYAA